MKEFIFDNFLSDEAENKVTRVLITIEAITLASIALISVIAWN